MIVFEGNRQDIQNSVLNIPKTLVSGDEFDRIHAYNQKWSSSELN